MHSDNDRRYIRIKKLTLVMAIAVIAAGLLGFWIGQSGNNSDFAQSTDSTNTGSVPMIGANNEASELKSLISYKAPDGWREFACQNASSSLFFNPKSTDCNSTSVVKVSEDAANNTDCNQLQNVQNVSKHICVSEYINGKKSLKAETIYNEQSAYQMDTTVRAYYINIGQTIIKVEYIDNTGNQYQVGFEQLAKSIKAK